VRRSPLFWIAGISLVIAAAASGWGVWSLSVAQDFHDKTSTIEKQTVKPPKVVYWFPSLGGEVQGFGVHQTGARPTHAIAAFERITRIARITRGNFRLLERLFPQIARVLKINDLETITDDVIEAAASILVIGN